MTSPQASDSGGGGGLSGGAIAGIVVGALFFVVILGASGRARLPARVLPLAPASTSRWPGSGCRSPALGAFLLQLGTSPACVSINP
jgi:hypothetical protein